MEKATEIAKVSRVSGIGDFGKSGHENYIARERESVPILERRFTKVVRPPRRGRRSGRSEHNGRGFNQENGDRSIVIYYYNPQKVYEISAFVQVFSHVCLGS